MERFSTDFEAECQHTYIQLYTGVALPKSNPWLIRQDLMFSIGMASQIMLKVGAFIGIVWLSMKSLLNFFSYYNLVRSKMNYANILKHRDSVFKDAIRTYLSKEYPDMDRNTMKSSLEGIFKEASDAWLEREIDIVFGKKTAENIRKQINEREIETPKNL